MKKLLTTLSLSAIASPALAHSGHSHADGLVAGFIHPLMGADHLLAMVAVGLFGAAAMRDKPWVAPATFVAAMVGGALLSFGGFTLPRVEGGIALSVLVLGLMSAFALRIPAGLGLGLTAGFALFHGYAHGAEASGSAFTYVAGFVASTALLHGAGVLAGLKATAYRFALPVLGGGIATAGAVLLTA